jgi:DNA invertase Pin-like site-specific DNA recombinase
MKTKHILIYGRVSTADQSHDSQLREVQDYCARRWGDNVAITVITDTASGVKASREGLDQLMQLVRRNKIASEKGIPLGSVFRLSRSLRAAV